MANATRRRNPAAVTHHRNLARLTSVPVLHESEKDELVAAVSPLRRRRRRAELEAQWSAEESRAAAEAADTLAVYVAAARELSESLEQIVAVQAPELLGAAETEHHHVRNALDEYAQAQEALARGDFSAAGIALDTAEAELTVTGRSFVVALNKAMTSCAVGKEMRGRLEDNLAERRQAKLRFDHVKTADGAQTVAQAAARLRTVQADGFRLAAEVLRAQVRETRGPADVASVGRDNTMRVLAPHDCETFADVGGLERVKQQLRDTVGTILERPDEAARYAVVHNGILFYGPPGTGKNLLSRALAGEYGLRYLRFSPAAIASAYIHEAASNLRQVFELAVRSAPCVLYLDEIDTIASDRGDEPSADHREVVTQLMVCLEEYRNVPGLVIAAATNDIDRLDPALREGRFDAKIQVPLPEPADRAHVLEVHLRRRNEAVDWERIDLPALAGITEGYNAAALETIVSLGAQTALREQQAITGEVLAQAVASRGGQHRITLDETVSWDDVVLDTDTRDRVLEVLHIFSSPELARQVGVRPPAGVLLYGPPGTGKTTIAKAMASQISASFYEMSAADLLSKWAGESEQRVARLFARARANRPSIIFIDEIDALLRRRTADTASKWEERVLSQFLRELDGLKGGDGVLLVGATNRVDTIDDAITGRRLEPIEIGLPDALGRLKLLQVLCRDVKLARTVDLRKLTNATEGMSGADLKRLRDAAGRRALSRAAKASRPPESVNITMGDFQTAVDAQRNKASLAAV